MLLADSKHVIIILIALHVLKSSLKVQDDLTSQTILFSICLLISDIDSMIIYIVKIKDTNYVYGHILLISHQDSIYNL